MPETFQTPQPISATVEFDIGAVRVIATDRADTVVEVRPTDPGEPADVRAAEQTKISYTGGQLLVKGPRKRSLFGRSGSLDITLALPTGSDLRSDSPMADFHCSGPLGQARIKTSLGDLRVEEAATVSLTTGHGELFAEHVTGNAELTGSGRITADTVDGAATVKNSNGDIVIGEVRGELRATTSNGAVSVAVAHAGVEAKSANGHVRIGQVARGRITLQTAAGDISVGIAAATAAWLDVNTRLGSVRNSLGTTDGPGAGDETVEVRARSGVGDITIHRA
ncbi:DUF4097 family beta strand repeat-containing protein [Streptomyces sp. G-G2]|uniref:DUF4097 family beta strand repeat-containing protein n=1 Tax=Streptomyces sp. G-G2 TaxID=3046201 RepID=UPI0024BB850B|nr:DUF4097 family beta strand repeat-containing protein [Streptomyces sp. G-G2]MDJ0383040.1 DUF4097 family beta strand repeat-containing protein [Streptomyces sp. G-G2]